MQADTTKLPWKVPSRERGAALGDTDIICLQSLVSAPVALRGMSGDSRRRKQEQKGAGLRALLMRDLESLVCHPLQITEEEEMWQARPAFYSYCLDLSLCTPVSL